MESRVYILNIKDINVNINEFILPDYCADKISETNDQELKYIRAISWNLLTNILYKEYNIDLFKTSIYENDYGKPYIDDIYFNITHSGDYIGIIISNNECGIDIEKIELNVDIDKFAKKILTNNEYNNKENINIEYLISKWTKLEVYYKMIGEGITLYKLNKEVELKDITTIKFKNYFLSFSPKVTEIKYLNSTHLL